MRVKFLIYQRVERIIPTIDFLLKNKAKIILISHFGRPKGEKQKEFSLDLIINDVKTVLKKEIYFCDDNLRTIKRDKIDKLFKDNDIILENLRFYEEEGKIQRNFFKKNCSFRRYLHQ